MLEVIADLFSNPLVVLSVGVPTFIAVYQFWDARRKAPVERRLVDAETEEARASTKAAQAAEASNIAQVVNLMMGLIADMKAEIRRDFADSVTRQSDQIKRWVDEVVAQLKAVDERVIANTAGRTDIAMKLLEIGARCAAQEAEMSALKSELKAVHTELELSRQLNGDGGPR